MATIASSTRPVSWLRGNREALELGVISAILALPFLMLRDAPLFDLPSHAARQHILYDPAIAIAGQHYEVVWRVLPNLALDLFVGAFRYVMPIDWAIRLFLACTAVQLFLGTVALNRSLFGRDARFGRYAALLALNGPFLAGLINFSFGVGLGLWTLALALSLRRFWPRFVICGLLGIAILLCHLFAFALFGLVLGSHALGRALATPGTPGRRIANLVRGTAPLALPLLFHFALVPRNVDDNLAMTWFPVHKLFWLVALFSPYDLDLDAAGLGLLVLFLWAHRRGLAFAREMTLPMVALGAAYLCLPDQIGQATWIDGRVPAVFALVGAASLDWRQGWDSRLPDMLVGTAFAALMVFTVREWWSWQPVYAEYREALAMIEPGARLLPVNTHPTDLLPGEHPPVAHMDALAVTERGAFIPDIFADLPHELIRYTEADEKLHRSFTAAPDPADYDYVLIVNPDPAHSPAGLQEVRRGTGFVLERVIR
jgi:hypothetical protein